MRDDFTEACDELRRNAELAEAFNSAGACARPPWRYLLSVAALAGRLRNVDEVFASLANPGRHRRWRLMSRARALVAFDRSITV